MLPTSAINDCLLIAFHRCKLACPLPTQTAHLRDPEPTDIRFEQPGGATRQNLRAGLLDVCPCQSYTLALAVGIRPQEFDAGFLKREDERDHC